MAAAAIASSSPSRKNVERSYIIIIQIRKLIAISTIPKIITAIAKQIIKTLRTTKTHGRQSGRSCT
jgi:hypothetical protein